MATSIRLQRSHSRNSFDTKMVKTADGRNAFLANKKGVAFRIGLLVEMMEGSSISVADMAEGLKEVHSSYNQNDVSQPLKQMVRYGIAQRHGEGRDATYSLTSNGKRIWNAAKLNWK